MDPSRKSINVVFLINGLLYANWAARIPQIQSHFDLTYFEIGNVLLASAIGSVVGMPTAGYIINKYGSRTVTIFAAIVYILSIPAFMLSINILMLVSLFFIMGYAVGMLDVAMNDQAVEIEHRLQKPIMSFFHAMFSTGMMIGAACGILFNKINVSLLLDFVILSSIGLLLLRMVYSDFVDRATIELDHSTKSIIQLPSKVVLSIGLIAFCCMLGEGAMSDWTSQYMMKVAGSSDVIAPTALFGFSVAMMVGRFLGDGFRIRWGDNRLMLIGATLSTLGIVLTILLPLPFVVVLGCVLVGLGLSTIVPIAYSIAGKLPGLGPGVGISMVTTIGYSGFLFGPPIIGYIAEQWSLREGFIFIGVLFTLMFVIISQAKKTISTR